MKKEIKDWNKIKRILKRISLKDLELEVAIRKAEKAGVFKKGRRE